MPNVANIPKAGISHSALGLRRLLIGRHPARTLLRASLLGACVWALASYVWLPVWVSGGSMLPTYHSGQFRLVSARAFARRPPRRGDIVAIRLAGRRVMFLKRVVGLPGERLEIREGVVVLDGAPLAEPYVRFREAWCYPETRLGTNQYFVIGDNRAMPRENHVMGKVQRERIAGRILW